MIPQEAVILRKDLKRQINRAHKLTERLTTAAADRSNPLIDRETAYHRAKLSIETSQSLEASLERIQDALSNA